MLILIVSLQGFKVVTNSRLFSIEIYDTLFDKHGGKVGSCPETQDPRTPRNPKTAKNLGASRLLQPPKYL